MLISCPTEILEPKLNGLDNTIRLLADAGFDLPRDALTPEEGAQALADILGERRKTK